VKCDTEEELLTLLAKVPGRSGEGTIAQARSLDLVCAVIADAGRTQIAPGSKTVSSILGCW
jgi:peptidyl-tRNA hydrolase